MTQEQINHCQQQAQLKATYGAIYDRLVDILYVADLAGISHFAKDEYEPEVATILPRLPEATCEADVERIIREEFAHWFYPGMTEHTPERYAWAARQMWQVRRDSVKSMHSPCHQRLTTLWWAMKLRFYAIMMPIRKPGRVCWVQDRNV